MQFTNVSAVLLTAAFVMPGFLWSAVLSMFLPRRANQIENRFLEFFALSCINNSIWFALFVYFALDDYFSRRPAAVSFWVFVALFVSPLVMGITTAKLAQTELVSRLLRRFGFRTVSYIKSAWDWHFSRMQPLWAVVTLKDGSIIYGYFGANSFAGDDPKDIYLEKTFKPEQNGFSSSRDNWGALIGAEQIAVIEFFNDKGEKNV